MVPYNFSAQILFFSPFFFFLLLSEYITFSSASKTFFNLLFFNEILRSNFIYAIFTPFFPLKEDSCLSLYVKRIENTPSFRIFFLFHKIRTASNIPFSFFFFFTAFKMKNQNKKLSTQLNVASIIMQITGDHRG